MAWLLILLLIVMKNLQKITEYIISPHNPLFDMDIYLYL